MFTLCSQNSVMGSRQGGNDTISFAAPTQESLPEKHRGITKHVYPW